MPRTRKFSGPLLPGTKSVRTYRKRKSKPKSGLNKTERKQVREVAQNVLDKNLEHKFFNSTPMNDLREIDPHAIQTGANMYCLGFATNTNLIRTASANATTIKYGSNTAMRPLHLARLFSETETDANLASYQLVGEECKVSFAKSKWLIERTAVDTTPGVGEQTLDALPMMVRLIRVRPKALKGSFVWPNPEEDLFLDQYSQNIGIKRVGFKKDDLALLKVNNRRYSVIQDTTFTLTPPLTTSTFDIANGNTQVSNVSTNSKRSLNMKHNIGKKFRYNRAGLDQENNYPNSPSMGFVPEYILFHFQLLGDDTIVGRRSADDIRITCCPVSAFKDA